MFREASAFIAVGSEMCQMLPHFDNPCDGLVHIKVLNYNYRKYDYKIACLTCIYNHLTSFDLHTATIPTGQKQQRHAKHASVL